MQVRPDEWLVDADRVCKMLGVSRRFVAYRTATGELPSLLLGRARRYEVPEVVAWAKSESVRAKLRRIKRRSRKQP